jgi:hypothetical protein
MTLQDLLSALGSHNYLAVFVLLTLYVRKATGPDSKIPLEISATWRPVLSAAAGLVYGVLSARTAGTDWANAVVGGVLLAGSSGFLDGLLTAIFNHGVAPAWAKALVGIFDDLTATQAPLAQKARAKPAIRFGRRTATGPNMKPMFPDPPSAP